MSFNPDLNKAQKSYIFMENDKIISLTNLCQYLLSAEILSGWKIEKFSNECKEQTNSKPSAF